MTTRARWSDPEWDKLCLQLYRTQPVAAMTNVALIRKGDVEEAMKVALPKERWHISTNMTNVRPKLKERFNSLRDQLQQVEVEQRELSRRQEEAERLALKTRQRVDVFAPMIDVIAERLFVRMQPMFESYLASRLGGEVPEDATETAVKVHEAKPDKIRLGVVGLIPIQEQEVIKHFSNFTFVEFTFYDKDRGQKGFKSWAHNLDNVFILTAKVPHGYERLLPDNFSRVSGRGTTAMIRDIEIWLAAHGWKAKAVS